MSRVGRWRPCFITFMLHAVPVTRRHQLTVEIEPWLSSCRAVEAPSSRCRGRCRGAVEALPVEPVEPVKADSMRLGVEGYRAVEFLSSFSVDGVEAVELCAVECAVELEPGM
jgi:hypothetical protein